MRILEIPRVGYRLESLKLTESVIYTISMTEHLNGDTIREHTFAILDSDGEDVTANFGKNSSVSSDVCTLGINAYAVGVYTIVLWLTCNEYLPDSVTFRKFKIEITLTVK